mmetsp:Transcript_9265/g.25003  ORF Transcript_9265/g.25003 Transcript_9265/m.25003 type:complete len:232 (-) Transcript_9265:1034-1729(-)
MLQCRLWYVDVHLHGLVRGFDQVWRYLHRLELAHEVGRDMTMDDGPQLGERLAHHDPRSINFVHEHAAVVRHEHHQGHHLLLHLARDGLQQRLNAVPLGRRHANGLLATGSHAQHGLRIGACVQFIPDCERGNVGRLQLVQDLVDGVHLCCRVWMGRVHHVQQQRCVFDFLQSRPKGGNQLCGKPLDETDGVGEQNLLPAGEHDSPGRRVQGGEKLVLGEDARVREGVQQA